MENSLKFFPKSPIISNAALVQVMACCLFMFDTIWHHMVTVSCKIIIAAHLDRAQKHLKTIVTVRGSELGMLPFFPLDY